MQVRVKVPITVRAEILFAVLGEILLEAFLLVRVEMFFPSNPRRNRYPNHFSVTRRRHVGRHLDDSLARILHHTLAQGLGLALLLAFVNPVCYVSLGS